MKNFLIFLCGIPFSGKSYIAEKIVNDFHAVRIDLDEDKFEQFGDHVQDSQLVQKDWDKIYQVMHDRIEESLRNGRRVVHDTGNFTVYERGLVREIAKKLSVPFVTVFINTPVGESQRRLIRNKQAKERFDVTDTAFQVAVDEMEPPTKDENPIELDSTDDYTLLIMMLEQTLGLKK